MIPEHKGISLSGECGQNHSLLGSDIECVGRAFPCTGLDIWGRGKCWKGTSGHLRKNRSVRDKLDYNWIWDL